jgi:alkylation response protein AidB-like acyl-CoA dehydrogenase
VFDRYVKRGIAHGILAAVLPAMVGGAIRGPFHHGPVAAELARDGGTGAAALASVAVLHWAIEAAAGPAGEG